MKNWKTTTLGVLNIIIAVATAAASFIKTGSCDIMLLGSNVAIGYALIQAKDATAK